MWLGLKFPPECGVNFDNSSFRLVLLDSSWFRISVTGVLRNVSFHQPVRSFLVNIIFYWISVEHFGFWVQNYGFKSQKTNSFLAKTFNIFKGETQRIILYSVGMLHWFPIVYPPPLKQFFLWKELCLSSIIISITRFLFGGCRMPQPCNGFIHNVVSPLSKTGAEYLFFQNEIMIEQYSR